MGWGEKPEPKLPSERERQLERALRLVRMALTREEHGVHDLLAVVDNALGDGSK